MIDKIECYNCLALFFKYENQKENLCLSCKKLLDELKNKISQKNKKYLNESFEEKEKRIEQKILKIKANKRAKYYKKKQVTKRKLLRQAQKVKNEWIKISLNGNFSHRFITLISTTFSYIQPTYN